MTEWIKLNVGGQTFLTTKLTLLSEPDSMLATMFSGELPPGSKDDQGAYMIDRTPEYFKPILNYLRRGVLVIDPMISKEGLLAEAQYYGIKVLVDLIEKNIEDAAKIAWEEKEKEKTEYNLRLYKESLICRGMLITQNPNGIREYNTVDYRHMQELQEVLKKIKLD